MRKTAFDIYHPLVSVSYFTVVLVFSMVLVQPVFIALSFLGGFAYSLSLQGLHKTLKRLVWQIPLIVIIAVVNPLFAAIGSTELFRVGSHPVYLESLIYGACFGALLVTVMIWFQNASLVLTADKITALLGNRVPTLALIITMMLRFVPRLLMQGTEIQTIQQVNEPREPGAKKARIGGYVRQTTVLMGWSMENSLETADAMRSRGWRAATKRTTYRRYSFTARDIKALVVLLLIAAATLLFSLAALGQSQFYPTLHIPAAWGAYGIFTLLACLPLIAEAIEDIRWRL